MSECPDTRDSPVEAGRRIHKNAGKPDFDSCPNNGVRELLQKSTGSDGCQRASPRPAHPSNGLVAQLSSSWRVVADPLQWILQRRKGNPRSKNSGWESRAYCTTRTALVRCIREYCCWPDGEQFRSIREYRGVDLAAVQYIRELPHDHVDWIAALDDVAHSAHEEPPQ